MTDASKEKVDQLLADFASKDGVTRRAARAAIVQIGSAAVPALLDALDAPLKRVRWEAAKSLVEIAKPAAAERLVAALADEDPDVRWVVAEALIALGRDAVRPLLTFLMKPDLTHGVYEGAHHVVNDLVKRGDLAALLEPVLAALDHRQPKIAVPLAAEEALQSNGV